MKNPRTNKQGVRDLNGKAPIPTPEPLHVFSSVSAVASDLQSAQLKLAKAVSSLQTLCEILPHSVFGPVLDAAYLAERNCRLTMERLQEIEIPWLKQS